MKAGRASKRLLGPERIPVQASVVRDVLEDDDDRQFGTTLALMSMSASKNVFWPSNWNAGETLVLLARPRLALMCGRVLGGWAE